VTTLLLGAVLGVAAPGGAQPRVHPDARVLRDHRLSLDNVLRLDRVTRALDAWPRSAPTRPDVVLFIGLQGAWVGDSQWHDATVDAAVRVVEGGDPALPAAIRGAGLSPREYVLTQMTLMLAHEAAAFRRRRAPVPPSTDVSPENVAFVETHWAEVNRVMTDFMGRLDAEGKRLAPR
jgi:hypothetical protein